MTKKKILAELTTDNERLYLCFRGKSIKLRQDFISHLKRELDPYVSSNGFVEPEWAKESLIGAVWLYHKLHLIWTKYELSESKRKVKMAHIAEGKQMIKDIEELIERHESELEEEEKKEGRAS